MWRYTRLADNPLLVNVYMARRLPNGNTLIVDRRADFVIEVTPAKRTVWRYGAMPDSLRPGSLVDPFYAERLANGNTLIVDDRGGRRVIEVRTSDYDAGAPGLGYTADSIVWQYGQDGVAGIGWNQLASPRCAQRLPNGNTVITDSGDRDYSGNRIIEVTSDRAIVWQFGVAGQAGVDPTHLTRPSAAQRLPNGNTVITEEDGQRMLEVNSAGAVVDLYAPGGIDAPGVDLGVLRSVDRTVTGTTLVSDQENQRVVELGYPLTGTVTSEGLWLGLPGVLKVISRIEVTAERPAGTSVTVAYSLDGGAWRTLDASGRLPANSIATSVRYRVMLATTSAAYTPVLRQVRITHSVAPLDLGEPEPVAGVGTGKPRSSTTTSVVVTAAPGGATTVVPAGASGGTGGGVSGVSAGGGGTGSSSAGGLATLPQGAAGELTRGTLLQPVAISPDGDSLGAGTGAGGTGTRGGGRGWTGILVLSYLAGVGLSAYAGGTQGATHVARLGFGRS